jgi:hypothetical protein
MLIMMILNMSTSYFHKFSFHYFEDYNDETNFRVRYCQDVTHIFPIGHN